MEEHFDGIDAIEFYNSRLSRRKRRRNRDSGKEGFNKKENVSSSPLSIPKTEERHEKARRALILRCWERAVHAASCDVACDSSSVANPSNNDDFYFFPTQSQCDVDSASHDGSCDAIEKEGMPDQLTTERMSKVENIEDEALGRCSRLGIKLPWSEKTNDTGRNHDYLTSKIHQSEEEDRKEEGKRGTAGTDVPLRSYKCNICSASDFASEKELQQHFIFGDNGIKSCYHDAVEERMYDLVDDVLDREAMNVIDGLLHVLLSGVSNHMTETSYHFDIRDKRMSRKKWKGKKFDWRDVLKFLHSSGKLDCSSSSDSAPSAEAGSDNACVEKEGGISDTVDLHPCILPIPLNERLLKSLSMRLMNRYVHRPLITI
mmetsp:Transcript_9571/g.14278  ORF Transcript_9571/g.14278 Transcript_9571/m.14278 type:complete len:373 (-) Transcript_9571:503-1621(-)